MGQLSKFGAEGFKNMIYWLSPLCVLIALPIAAIAAADLVYRYSFDLEKSTDISDNLNTPNCIRDGTVLCKPYDIIVF